MKQLKRLLWIVIAMCMLCFLGCADLAQMQELVSSESQELQEKENAKEDNEGRAEEIPDRQSLSEPETAVTEDGQYTSKEEVAAYIHRFGHLPDNFISKTKARKLGWDSKAGNLQEVAPGMSIGGSHYQNYDGALPEAEGRTWVECDIDYEGGYRGAKRIIFSNDGLIYYTEDHYETFEQLY